MNLNDQQLDQILKQIDVPGDLKARLNTIACEENSASKVLVSQSNPFKLSHVQIWQIIATSALVLISTFGAWQWYQWATAQPKLKTEVAASDRTHSQIGPSISVTEANQLIAEIQCIERQMAELRKIQIEMEIEKLDQKITTLRSKTYSIRSTLPANEAPALSIALAAESAISSGTAPAFFRNDLDLTVEKFPGTQGAELAKQLLLKYHNHP